MVTTHRAERRTEPGHHRRGPPPSQIWPGYVVPALALVAFFYFAQAVLLPICLAGVLSMALKPGMRWFARWHTPAVVAASIMAIVFLSAVGGIFYHIARPAVEWVNRAPAAAQDLQKKMEKLFHLHNTEKYSEDGGPLTNGPANSASPVHLPSYDAGTIIAWTGATLTGIIETIVILFLILISQGWFSDKLAAFLAPRYDRPWVLESINELQHQISRYLFSITLINLVFGLIIGCGVALIGLPNAVMWGAMATILNYIPYFGPIVGMAIVTVAGILTFDSFPREILPLGLYLGLHILEADLVTPSLLGNRFTVHPLIIFVALIFWTWLWGVPGALLAVPLLVALKVACERVPQLSAIAELLRK